MGKFHTVSETTKKKNPDLLDSYQVLKTENQELINAVTKDANYVKII